MRKIAVVSAAIGMFITFSVSVQAADWESVKERARALGNEAAEFTKESWDDTADWRQQRKEDASELTDKAKEKSMSLYEVGQKKLDKLMERDSSEKEGNE